MNLIRLFIGQLKKKVKKVLYTWLVNLIDKSGLLFYNQGMEADFLLVQQALLEDAAQRDTVTARRKLLMEFLSRERYLTRRGLMSRVEMVLGFGCFGNASWEDVFYRDMKAVKKSFRAAGYGESVARQIKGAVEKIDPKQVEITRTLSPAQRVQQGLSITKLAQEVTSYRRSKQVVDHG